MATATNQDILEAYQQSIGAGEGQVNTQLLIQALRERQRMAELQDMDRAGRIKSVGKTGLNLLKARRDFLLAKRGNPNLKFSQFMSDPKTAGKYMEQGAKSVVSGDSPAIGLKETLNPFSREYARNLNVEALQSSPEYQSLRQSVNQAIPSAEASMLPNQPLGQMPGFDNVSNLPSPPPPPPPPPAMGDVSGEGLSSLLRRGQTPIVPQVTTQYASPSQVASMTRANPIQMEAVDAVTSPLQGIRRGASSLGLDGIEKVAVPESAQGASQGAGIAGTAGRVLGGVGSAVTLGSGLKDIASGRGDLSAVAKTGAGALGLASALGLANPLLGLGLGLLSRASQRR